MLLALQVRDALLGDWQRYEIGGDGLREGDYALRIRWVERVCLRGGGDDN